MSWRVVTDRRIMEQGRDPETPPGCSSKDISGWRDVTLPLQSQTRKVLTLENPSDSNYKSPLDDQLISLWVDIRIQIYLFFCFQLQGEQWPPLSFASAPAGKAETWSAKPQLRAQAVGPGVAGKCPFSSRMVQLTQTRCSFRDENREVSKSKSIPSR